MAASISGVIVPLHPNRPGLPEVEVIVYGITVQDARTVPSGGRAIRRAARLCGLDPDDYSASLFEVRPNFRGSRA